ncbi:MAG: LysR family transcriptional regulator [Proteobacteria bacterium]|nr:LysR family transcriptional regulator [Pseudomonadota bacterium]
MNIELRLLQTFVEIYESGSLARAAQRCHCSQATMSLRLKMLEEHIGHRLFLRQHQRLEPTAMGAEIYAKALAVIASYDELVATSRSRDSAPRVRIGVPDDYALSYVSRVLRHVARDFQGVSVEIVCDLSANLVAAVQRQDLDLALATVVSAPADTPLIGEAELAWVEARDGLGLARLPIPLAVYPEGCVFRRAMIAALESARIPWRIVAQSRSQAGVLTSVRAGCGVTAMAVGTMPDDIVRVSDKHQLPALGNVPIYLFKRNGELGKVLETIVDAVREQVSSAAVNAA